MRSTVSQTYHEPVMISAFLQVLVAAGLAAVPHKGPVLHVAVFGAFLAYWASVALIMVRRPDTPSPRDCLYIRVGFPPLLGVLYVLSMMMIDAG